MAKKFITSALPYVNNQPHLGNIVGCVLGGDIYARYCRKCGHDVVYVSGTDEYGTATEMEALRQGVRPVDIVDRNRALHTRVYEWLNLRFDKFGSTTCGEHREMTQEVFRRCYENGYFQEQSVSQRFCRGCDQFLPDRYVSGTCGHCGYSGAHGDQCEACSKYLGKGDLRDPVCALCGVAPEERSTRHLYLRLDLLKESIEQCFAGRKGRWTKGAQDMYEKWMGERLQARCMTRSLRHRWGVPVPLEGFEDKVFYVWFDAPIGYFTFLRQARPDWREWVADAEFVQFMGKDNVPFHSIIFPGMLLAALRPESLKRVLRGEGRHTEYPTVDVISSTGYLLFNGQKFSKSKRVGIFGLDLVTRDVGCPDFWRYYLTRRRPETGDSNFAVEDFIVHVKADLVDNLGNLFNRTLRYIWARLSGHVRIGELDEGDQCFVGEVNGLLREYHARMEATLLRGALEKLMELSQRGNQYLQRHQGRRERMDHAFSMCYSLLVLLAHMAEPFVPDAAERMYALCGVPAGERMLPTEFGLLERAEVPGEPSVLFAPLSPAQLAALREFDAPGRVEAL